jgi:outer membrane protein TolC
LDRHFFGHQYASSVVDARSRPWQAGGANASLLFLLFAGLLGGCAAYEPIPLVPEDELVGLRSRSVDDYRIERARPGAEVQGGVELDPSDGLDEVELVSLALTLNPDLRARRLEIGEAQAMLITAGIWPNPELGAGLRPGVSGGNGLAVDLDLLFALLRPEERNARKAASGAHLDFVRSQIAAEEQQLAAAVQRARLDLLAGEQFLRLLEQESGLRDRAAEMIRAQRDLGEANEMAVALVELERAGVRRELRAIQSALAERRRELNRIIGLPPAYALQISAPDQPVPFTIYEELGDEDLDRRLLAGNAALRAAAAKYQRAEQDLRLAIARQYPGLGLGPALEREVNGDATLGLGFAFEIPLFDRNQGEVAEQRAARARVRAEYLALLHNTRAAAFDARAKLQRARAELESQAGETGLLIRSVEDLFESALRARELTIFEWIAARDRVLEAQRALLEALIQHERMRIEFETATGMPLSQAPAQPEPETQERK